MSTPSDRGALPELCWLGRRSYVEVLAEQREHRAAILRGEAREAIWLLEHDPVITTGIRPVSGLDAGKMGIPVVSTERGGLATYHGPGQLVGYLLIDVGKRGGSVRGTVCAVEAALIRWLSTQGLAASRREGFPGVWVGREKIAAVGLHFRRGVTMHGFALNLRTDLDGFSGFVPCGITDGGVTSLERLLGASPSPEEAAPGVGGVLIDEIAARMPVL